MDPTDGSDWFDRTALVGPTGFVVGELSFHIYLWATSSFHAQTKSQTPKDSLVVYALRFNHKVRSSPVCMAYNHHQNSCFVFNTQQFVFQT